MKIIKYKRNNNGFYDIYLENNDKISLHEDVILKNNLLITKQVEDKKILEKENEISNIYATCIKYISYKMRCKKEIIEYLNKKNISKEIINKNIKRLENEGYINDEKYVKAYIKDQINLSNYGPNKIKMNLINYGIDENIINNNIKDINNDKIKEKLNKLILKKIRIIKGSKREIKIKVINYFYNLGYEKSMIEDIISNINIETDINKLKKEYSILCKKYNKKYKKEEIDYLIINKLLLKGYTKEEIKEIKS